jgi:hypothetical protein
MWLLALGVLTTLILLFGVAIWHFLGVDFPFLLWRALWEEESSSEATETPRPKARKVGA